MPKDCRELFALSSIFCGKSLSFVTQATAETKPLRNKSYKTTSSLLCKSLSHSSSAITQFNFWFNAKEEMRESISSAPKPLLGIGSPNADAISANTACLDRCCQQFMKIGVALPDSSPSCLKTSFAQDVFPDPGGPNKNKFL